jgi:hypothetical protein
MNRLLRTVAAATLIACYALPVRAEAPPKFADHAVKVCTGKSEAVRPLRRLTSTSTRPCLENGSFGMRRTFVGAQAKMANGRAEAVANTGHLVFLEAPAKYSELVLGFLAVAP